jgi:hypothetical protein
LAEILIALDNIDVHASVSVGLHGLVVDLVADLILPYGVWCSRIQVSGEIRCGSAGLRRRRWGAAAGWGSHRDGFCVALLRG